ncbi:hypothetical protein [Bacillus cereus]|uniref:hypothetical protein n=1 Tax=Bacillus cereus TaxID=1396 RepID=UPI001C0C7517|nr:hypothetical protein [Bacillus cereus]QWS01194.1 hypothetical protein IMY50_29810 [Bacillus cereus]
MIRKNTSDKSNSNFRQQESAMKELDKNVETAEQRNISQAKNAIESPQQETDSEKLQKNHLNNFSIATKSFNNKKVRYR